jgi:hypothetical protein
VNEFFPFYVQNYMKDMEMMIFDCEEGAGKQGMWMKEGCEGNKTEWESMEFDRGEYFVCVDFHKFEHIMLSKSLA